MSNIYITGEVNGTTVSLFRFFLLSTSTIGLDSFTDDSELKELCAVDDVADLCGKLDLSGGAKGWICP